MVTGRLCLSHSRQWKHHQNVIQLKKEHVENYGRSHDFTCEERTLFSENLEDSSFTQVYCYNPIIVINCKLFFYLENEQKKRLIRFKVILKSGIF